MISTIIIWAYILVLTSVYGFAATRILKRLFRLEDSMLPFTLVVLTGLIALTTIVGYLSVFSNIGLVSNALLLVFAVVLGFIEREELGRVTANCLEEIKKTDKCLIGLLLLVFIAVLMQSTITARIYDTGAYHAQSIKWIEDYGLVPGLANLNPKLGFNSSWLWINALFSLSFLRSEPFHVLNGWFLLLITVYAVGRWKRLAAGDFEFGSIMGTAIPLIGLPLFWSSLSSPDLDMPVIVTLWWLFILFADGTMGDTPVFNLQVVLTCVLTSFLVTLKLSAAPILIVLLYILGAAFLKGRKDGFALAGLAFVIVAPWFIRNILQSGYLIYPFPYLDMFGFDWRVPFDLVLNEVRWIASWARIPELAPDQVLAMPWYVWVPIWFQRLPTYYKLLSLWILGFSCVAATRLVMSSKSQGQVPKQWGRFILWATTCISVAFWFVTAPAFRFGLGFLLPFAILLAVAYLNQIGHMVQRIMRPILLTALAAELVILYHTIDFSTLSQRAVFPAPYPQAETRIMLLNNVRVNVPVVTDQCWLAPLPCTPYPNSKLELRDGTLEGGFRMSAP